MQSYPYKNKQVRHTLFYDALWLPNLNIEIYIGQTDNEQARLLWKLATGLTFTPSTQLTDSEIAGLDNDG